MGRKGIFTISGAQTYAHCLQSITLWILEALLDEECLAQLVAAYVRLHRAKSSKELLDFAVLIEFLGRKDGLRFQYLERGGVDHAVSLESWWLFAVKQRKHDATRPHQFCQVRHRFFRQLRLQIVERVPQQHGVKRSRRVLQIVI